VHVTDLREVLGRLRLLSLDATRLDAIAAALPPVEVAPEDGPPVIVVSDAIHPIARAELSALATLIDVDGTNLPALLDVMPRPTPCWSAVKPR
jgi:hypothetical protein